MSSEFQSSSAGVFGKGVLLALCLRGTALIAQENDRVELGRLETGATVSFIRGAGGKWGIEITGSAAPAIRQPKPAKLEVYRSDEDIRQLAAGYTTVRKSASGIEANAEITYGE